VTINAALLAEEAWRKLMHHREIEDTAAILSAMGNPVRLVVLTFIVEGERSVGEIANYVGLSQSAVSQHLAKLRTRKLVTTRRHRQTIFYACKSTVVLAILQTLSDISPGLRPGDRRLEKTATATI